MRELIERLKREFQDEETRNIYCDEFLNAYIATQIKVLREQRGRMTQAALAELARMRPERISVLEDVNYSSWTLNILRRLARAFGLRLSVKFETFGSFFPEFEAFHRNTLERLPFEEDPVFQQLSSNVSNGLLDRLAKREEYGTGSIRQVLNSAATPQRPGAPTGGEKQLDKSTSLLEQMRRRA